MEIYTSYFGKIDKLREAGIVPICIALWRPKWYTGLWLPDVAPKAFMLKGDYTQEQYIYYYKKCVLNNLRVEDVVKKIEVMSGGRDVALICYEKPTDFCHRHLLADWMISESGLCVTEFGDSKEEPKPKKPVPEQLSLF